MKPLLTRACRTALALALALWAAGASAAERASNLVNVRDYGAKGDGVHDDTSAIQAAINAVAERGAGVVYFPYAKGGYRLASPAPEMVDGKPCRSQLYVPARQSLNICFRGELPCTLLHPYGVSKRFGTQDRINTFLFSDWKPPVETNAAARPWSMLSVLPGWTSKDYPLNHSLVTIESLEFRAYLDKDLMCAVQSGANLQDSAEAVVRDSQFALNDQIGDVVLKKELTFGDCHAAGLIMSGELNDQQIVHDVNVQGFKYGIVMAEHTYGNYIYLHDNQYALTFTGSAHLSKIDFVTAQMNQCILCVPDWNLFGRGCGPESIVPVNVTVDHASIEDGENSRPRACRLAYGVYDPNNRLRGRISYYEMGFGSYPRPFKVVGAKRFRLCPHGYDGKGN